jgi:hypothetical protein
LIELWPSKDIELNSKDKKQEKNQKKVKRCKKVLKKSYHFSV